MGVGLGMPSIWTATSLSFAARKRNVTLLSECTSGEISGGGGVCAGVPATMQVPSRMAMDTMPSTENVRFMSPLIFRKCSAVSPSLDSERPRRGMIQQAALIRAVVAGGGPPPPPQKKPDLFFGGRASPPP